MNFFFLSLLVPSLPLRLKKAELEIRFAQNFSPPLQVPDFNEGKRSHFFACTLGRSLVVMALPSSTVLSSVRFLLF